MPPPPAAGRGRGGCSSSRGRRSGPAAPPSEVGPWRERRPAAGAEAAGSGAGGPVSRGGGAARDAWYPGAGLWPRRAAGGGLAAGSRGGEVPPGVGRARKLSGAVSVCSLCLPGAWGTVPPPERKKFMPVQPRSMRPESGLGAGGGLCLGSSTAGHTTAISRLPGGVPCGFIRLGQ